MNECITDHTMESAITRAVLTYPQGTEARVCEDIAARQKFGFTKYGTTVANNPLKLRQWLWHAYEEALDKAIYLRRACEELDRAQA